MVLLIVMKTVYGDEAKFGGGAFWLYRKYALLMIPQGRRFAKEWGRQQGALQRTPSTW